MSSSDRRTLSLQTADLVPAIDPEPEGFDSVQLLSSGVQIYFTLSKDFQTQVGIFFNTMGKIEFWIQQSAIPNNVLVQIKVIELHVPTALGFMFFFLGIATLQLKTLILDNRSEKLETIQEMKNWLDMVISSKERKAIKSK